ncbi:T9SS type A sorting domain-containing protein [Aureispira sp. CCB-E]|uniref:T9SS type A sorting domain-containing protein n=1 Tax=Aureispira sp. CCB-E TaxID=3051121 RepID=UPI0028689ABA|nr:T9SS type A sorting domain-containing protein [Aureispira sp. CCB-E]WMX12787.1 T9SS type A sorting domain-containing protein [Aureispira sp. CCB-E]
MTMKLTFFKNLFLWGAFMSLFSFSATAQWDTLGPALETNTAVDYNDIEVYNDTIYVAYSSTLYGGKALVKKYDGTTWQVLGGLGLSAGTAKKLDLVINSAGELYIAYIDQPNSNGVTVMKYGNGTWAPVGTVNIDNSQSEDPSLAFDNADVPHIAYVSGANFPQLEVVVKKFTGTWVDVGSALYTSSGSSNDVPKDVNITFPSTGVPHVSFVDGLGRIRTRKLSTSGTSWSVIGANINLAQLPHLGFDQNDNLYITYKDNTVSSKTSVRKLVGTSWTAVGVDGFTTGPSEHLNIAFNSSGVPYTVQTQFSTTVNAAVYGFDGNNWNLIGGQPAMGSVEYTDMVISNDVIYLVYKQFNTCYVVKYDLTVGIDQIPTLNNDITIYPNPVKNQLTVEGVEDIETIRILTMEGKIMETITTNRNVIFVENLPQGIYTIEVITEKGKGYKNFVKQ